MLLGSSAKCNREWGNEREKVKQTEYVTALFAVGFVLQCHLAVSGDTIMT